MCTFCCQVMTGSAWLCWIMHDWFSSVCGNLQYGHIHDPFEYLAKVLKKRTWHVISTSRHIIFLMYQATCSFFILLENKPSLRNVFINSISISAGILLGPQACFNKFVTNCKALLFNTFSFFNANFLRNKNVLPNFYILIAANLGSCEITDNKS